MTPLIYILAMFGGCNPSCVGADSCDSAFAGTDGGEGGTSDEGTSDEGTSDEGTSEEGTDGIVFQLPDCVVQPPTHVAAPEPPLTTTNECGHSVDERGRFVSTILYPELRQQWSERLHQVVYNGRGCFRFLAYGDECPATFGVEEYNFESGNIMYYGGDGELLGSRSFTDEWDECYPESGFTYGGVPLDCEPTTRFVWPACGNAPALPAASAPLDVGLLTGVDSWDATCSGQAEQCWARGRCSIGGRQVEVLAAARDLPEDFEGWSGAPIVMDVFDAEGGDLVGTVDSVAREGAGLFSSSCLNDSMTFTNGCRVIEEDLRQFDIEYGEWSGGLGFGDGGRWSSLVEREGSSTCLQLLECPDGNRAQFGREFYYVDNPRYWFFDGQDGAFSVRHTWVTGGERTVEWHGLSSRECLPSELGGQGERFTWPNCIDFSEVEVWAATSQLNGYLTGESAWSSTGVLRNETCWSVGRCEQDGSSLVSLIRAVADRDSELIGGAVDVFDVVTGGLVGTADFSSDVRTGVVPAACMAAPFELTPGCALQQ